ncbi:hypothetical protein [Streptomyces sp. NPDC003077]|uniref:hypothetical protein n=1 Tax=Streptomyces sp. NPDC003077 TaxID=3154443 RepID=UPI0033B48716
MRNRTASIASATRTGMRYEIRPSLTGDYDAVADLIEARLSALGDRSADALDVERTSVLDHVGKRVSERPVVWLLCRGAEVVACAAVRVGTPAWGWWPRQLAEAALHVSVFTDPERRHERLSRFVVWWALDYAWRLGQEGGPQIRWVRGSTDSEAVMRLARDEAGFAALPGVSGGRHAFLLQRAPQEMGRLRSFLASRQTGLVR